MTTASSSQAWRLSAADLAERIRAGELSARAATESVLARIAEVNPRINAVTEVLTDSARAAAAAADAAQARGEPLGPLHGVPVTIKINVDVEGSATTDGVVALKDNIAATDSPLVASLRAAGAIIVGRNNAPAFSLRAFTDNDLHGRTLNPFDPGVTPGGSSGGAAAAVATGMGPIAHGNDIGGSVRIPAWACGVVGLRTTVGRVPAYKATMPVRTLCNQMMSTQGPLTRTVADARLALAVMARGSALDPQWTPAPLEQPDAAEPTRVALFTGWQGGSVDRHQTEACEQAARWLEAAGYRVEPAEPPNFDELTALWTDFIVNDMRRGGVPAMQQHGDAKLRHSLGCLLAAGREWDCDQALEAMARRFSIAREWALFFERQPLLLMPTCWQRQFPIDHDQGSQAQHDAMLGALSPTTTTSFLGLPGLTLTTGLRDGLPVGVQLVATKFREDRLLAAGEVIERAAAFDVLAQLPR